MFRYSIITAIALTAHLAGACFTIQAQTIKVPVIGLSLPLEGRFSAVAKRVEFGALLALNELRSQNKIFSFNLVPSACDPTKAAQEAAQLLEANVNLVVGNLCFRHATALAQALNSEEPTAPTIPVISMNGRNSALDRLRRLKKLPLYALSASTRAEARAVVEQILPRFGGKPWALVDDGSVYGRSLSDAIRLLAEQAGLKPTKVDNFRPLQSSQAGMMRRLRQSGIEALFIASGPEDIATIMSDARTLSLDWVFATGEQASLLPFTAGANSVPDGLLMIGETLPQLTATPAVLGKLKGEDETIEPELLLGFLAVQIAAQAIEANDDKVGKEKLADLRNTTFSTIIGDVSFNEKGRLSPLPMVVQEWRNGRFVPVESN